MIQNIADRSKPLVVTSGVDVRVLLRLDRASFVDFALLLGTDFTDRIKRVGPVHAIRLIRKYGSIERVIDSMPQRPLPQPLHIYLARVKDARQTFGTLAPLPHWKRLQVREPDLEQVSRIMKGCGLSWALQQEWDGRNWV
ncbi:hypothetical protein SCP_1401400 [Sparassis crispa]|uniref:XPG-I domain-containing protein n=1 Tax=Sparassis crispa TaxID=139825 RepID=A0A401H2S4_9APHY|nr:hypothetical protein SCP_1401400 [Sparassis crispa]GBE88735.1 hypothetical protein SCP_1401400 [Sparassis crispa]